MTFLLADGFSIAHRAAARIMSRGMMEGKSNGGLDMNDLDRMALIGTPSAESIATDSANTASAYMIGHKSAVNASTSIPTAPTPPFLNQSRSSPAA